MKPKPPPIEAFRPGQHLQMLDEVVHDPYLASEKLSEPSACSGCGAVFHQGRWQWGKMPAGANATSCPACRRIREKLPAGYVTIQGKFAHDHRNEILDLVRNLESREKTEHPLKRIMSVEDDEDGLLITTTDIHLARGIGEALHHAYKGDLDYHFNDSEYLLRVRWKR